MALPANARGPAVGTHRIVSYKPQFLPPDEIQNYLGVAPTGGRGVLEWQDASGRHSFDLRANSPANLPVLSGAPDDVVQVETMIRAADVASWQIDLEEKILEIMGSKARDAGIDWQNLAERQNLNRSSNLEDREQKSSQTIRRGTTTGPGSLPGSRRTIRTSTRGTSPSARAELSKVLHLLEQKGAMAMRQAPRIPTLNNRQGTILDLCRVTYVARSSSYSNLFATASLDGGLTLKGLPSLGASGDITMRIAAEATALDGKIADNVKTGQMLENPVLVRNGESVVLGSRTDFREFTLKRRFPVLGHVLPFLFSRELHEREEIRSFMVLTPRVFDFTSNLDEETRKPIEGE